MTAKIVQFLSLVLLLLVTGVFWGTWFTLTRSLDSFSGEEFMHIGQVIIANVAVPMRIIMPACLVAMLLSVWFYKDRASAGFYLSVLSFALLLATLLLTLMVLVPIDNDINLWTASTIPQDWEQIRTRWGNYHAARTLTSVSGFAAYALAVLLYRRRPEEQLA